MRAKDIKNIGILVGGGMSTCLLGIYLESFGFIISVFSVFFILFFYIISDDSFNPALSSSLQLVFGGCFLFINAVCIINSENNLLVIQFGYWLFSIGILMMATYIKKCCMNRMISKSTNGSS